MRGKVLSLFVLGVFLCCKGKGRGVSYLDNEAGIGMELGGFLVSCLNVLGYNIQKRTGSLPFPSEC